MGKKREPLDSEAPETPETLEQPKKRNKPKKKKPDDPDAPESKISKRRLKREKHAARVAEAEEASHKAVRTQALSYLSLWKHNRPEWKFNKVKQIWLLKNKFDENKIPDELWEPLVEYFSAGSGSVKSLIVEDCQKIMRETEEQTEKTEGENAAPAEPSAAAYRRARSLIQNMPDQ